VKLFSSVVKIYESYAANALTPVVKFVSVLQILLYFTDIVLFASLFTELCALMFFPRRLSKWLYLHPWQRVGSHLVYLTPTGSSLKKSIKSSLAAVIPDQNNEVYLYTSAGRTGSV
jgi:hypothetical protein